MKMYLNRKQRVAHDWWRIKGKGSWGATHSQEQLTVGLGLFWNEAEPPQSDVLIKWTAHSTNIQRCLRLLLSRWKIVLFFIAVLHNHWPVCQHVSWFCLFVCLFWTKRCVSVSLSRVGGWGFCFQRAEHWNPPSQPSGPFFSHNGNTLRFISSIIVKFNVNSKYRLQLCLSVAIKRLVTKAKSFTVAI